MQVIAQTVADGIETASLKQRRPPKSCLCHRWRLLSHRCKCCYRTLKGSGCSRFAYCSSVAVVAPPCRPCPLPNSVSTAHVLGLQSPLPRAKAPQRCLPPSHSLYRSVVLVGLVSYISYQSLLFSSVVHLQHRGGVVCHCRLFGGDAQACWLAVLRISVRITLGENAV